MLHRVRSLVTVLALGLPALAAADRAEDPTSTFLKQDKYTWCDAKILAAVWKKDVSQAKAKIGMNLQAGTTGKKFLDAQLVTAHQNAVKSPPARCEFHETEFTYEDAEALAKVWKTTVEKAKARVETTVAASGEAAIRKLLPAKQAPAANPANAFFNQERFTYCDAKLLSAAWKSSMSDTKAVMGTKIEAHAEPYLESELATARKGTKVRCSYGDEGFTYADVEKLAAKWKLTPEKAKAMIETKLVAGQVKTIRDALKPAPARMVPPPIKPPPPAPTKAPAPKKT